MILQFLFHCHPLFFFLVKLHISCTGRIIYLVPIIVISIFIFHTSNVLLHQLSLYFFGHNPVFHCQNIIYLVSSILMSFPYGHTDKRANIKMPTDLQVQRLAQDGTDIPLHCLNSPVSFPIYLFLIFKLSVGHIISSTNLFTTHWPQFQS